MNFKEYTIAFYTLGCKVNYAESSYISNLFTQNGFQIKAFNEKADVYVINTCSVTQVAVKKSRYFIHKALQLNPEALVVVTGCLTETEKEEVKTYDSRVLVVGANEKFNIMGAVNNRLRDNATENRQLLAESHFFSAFSSGDRTRSFVKIQDGCNYFCAYCVIPYARGRSRSDYIENILSNVKTAVNQNIKEIILTGINIGDYQNDRGENLYALLSALEEMEGLRRVRLSSIEPDLLSTDIIKLVSESQKLMPHFHIPLQSGSDNILKLMNRRYSTGFYRDKIVEIKNLIPDACVATDIISGFPGETDADFDLALAFLDTLPLSYFHVFTYSDRTQAKASGFKDKVPSQVKKQRTDGLLKLSDEKKMSFYNSQLGKHHQVLFESDKKKGFIYGFTENYIRVKAPCDKALVNNIVPVRLTALDSDNVFFVAF